MCSLNDLVQLMFNYTSSLICVHFWCLRFFIEHQGVQVLVELLTVLETLVNVVTRVEILHTTVNLMVKAGW